MHPPSTRMYLPSKDSPPALRERSDTLSPPPTLVPSGSSPPSTRPPAAHWENPPFVSKSSHPSTGNTHEIAPPPQTPAAPDSTPPPSPRSLRAIQIHPSAPAHPAHSNP